MVRLKCRAAAGSPNARTLRVPSSRWRESEGPTISDISSAPHRAIRRSLGLAFVGDPRRASTPIQSSSLIDRQARQRHFPIGNVVVDAFHRQMLAGSIGCHVLDDSISPQLGNDIVALGIRVRIGGVSDLECELGQRQAGIFGAGADPENAGTVGWAVGVQPEVGRPQCVLGTREAQCPKSYVVALAWAVINCLLETDVLAASEKIEGAERGGRIGGIEYERPDHGPRA